MVQGEVDPSVTLKGPEYIDIPGHAEREYKLGFYAYREGVTQARVTFTNEETNEFLFYDVSITAGTDIRQLPRRKALVVKL